MKRDDITALLPEIGKEALDQIMNLHGADLTALRGQLTQAQRDLTEARGQLKDYDPEWRDKLTAAETAAQTQLDTWKREAAIDRALTAAGARNPKAVRALLDLDKVTQKEDGALEGLADQLEALTQSEGYLFGAQTAQTQATGMTTGGEHGQGGSADQDGVADAFSRLNPWYKT